MTDAAPETAPTPLSGVGAVARTSPGRRRRREDGRSRLGVGSGVNLGVLVMWLSLLVLLPLAAVVSKAFSGGWHQFWDFVYNNAETWAAIKLTVYLALGVAVFNAIMGTLVAWVLVRERFPGVRLLEFVIDLPFALPTIVAGLVMLGLYGDDSPVGISLFGTRTGLFVALLFVTVPFTVRSVQPVLLDLDRDAEQAAASLGAGALTTFRRIVLPPILPAVLSGAALSFARALGEYGSLVLITSNLPFKTETAPRLIYAKLQDSDHPITAVRQAAGVATVLLLASAIVLLVINLVQMRLARRG